MKRHEDWQNKASDVLFIGYERWMEPSDIHYNYDVHFAAPLGIIPMKTNPMRPGSGYEILIYNAANRLVEICEFDLHVYSYRINCCFCISL